MKTTNLQQGHATDIARGRANPHRATGRGITTRDAVTEVEPVTDILFVGATVTEGDDGTVVVTIGGAGTPGGTDTDTAHTGIIQVRVTDSGSTQTLDTAAAGLYDITLTANCTISFVGAVEGVTQLQVILRQGGSGSYTVTWPGEVVWQDSSTGLSGASAPTLFTAVGAQNALNFVSLDAGASWGGSMGSAASGRWELAVIPGSPPDSLYAGGDWLYIFVP